MPRCLKMNSNDISKLSYRELQALALTYRVPGNIKKKLLVKVLQAAKGGNENEVGRLLKDLKQNRKKRVRKIKTGKLGITSTPLHSPNYVMADDYYCPQQQPPYQWVGAEEEIVSRDDDTRIPHYEEFKQFLLRRMQREFQTYDSNNNQVQESAIVDLRTATAPSNMHTVHMDNGNFARSNIIAVNNTDSFVYQPNDHVEYQTLEDSNGNTQGSILLKKMLQAPVGANLGEIASPVYGGYRLWSMEQYQSNNNLLDNSDTLTAESENDDNEDNLESNTECYGLLNGVRGEYLLNVPTFVKNVEDIGQQISNVLTNENSNQYKYSAGNIDTRQNYENWTITNVMDPTETNCITSDAQSSKIFQTMYYDNTGSDGLSKPSTVQDESLTCHYRVTENMQSYNSNQNLLNLNPSEENQYYDPNMIHNVQSDSPSSYYLHNLVKFSGETTGEYFHNVHSLSRAPNMEQDAYTSTVSQTFPNDNHYNTDIPYEYTYTHSNHESNIPLSDNVEQQQPQQQEQQQQQQQPQQVTTVISKHETNVQNESIPDRVDTSAGVLEPFCPKWSSKSSSNTILENVLNLYNTKCIDLSKLDQTSCVYCYIAPIVTHTPVSSSSSCSQKERFVAEYRHHSFTPYWLLYNDTSCGMRMANLQARLREPIMEEVQMNASMSNSNSDIRESTEGSVDSMNETWGPSYTNYEGVIEKDVHICEDINTEVTDGLFSVITTGPLDTQVDIISPSHPQ